MSCNFGGFDFIIDVLPKGMLMPCFSSPPNATPFWNDHKTKNIEALFEIAFVYFTNDGPLLLYVHEKKGVKDDVRTFVASYDFLLQ